MMKRMIPLLAMAILFAVAPTAMAHHCYRCRIVPQPQVSTCTIATGAIGGQPDCYNDEDGCHLSGVFCPPHTAAMTPLAQEYSIASVERLGEPQPATDATRVAALDVPATR